MHTQGAHELASFFFPHLHLTNCIHAVKSTDPEEGIHVSKAFLWTGKAEEIIRRGTMFSGIKQAGFKMQQIWSRNDDRTKCTVPKVTRAVGLSVVMWPFCLFPTQKCVNPRKKKKKNCLSLFTNAHETDTCLPPGCQKWKAVYTVRREVREPLNNGLTAFQRKLKL